MSLIFIRAFMWLWWLLLVMSSVLMPIYIPRSHVVDHPLDAYVVTLFVFPVVVCGGLRYLVARFGNPWLVLLTFLFGVFFAENAGAYGIFLLPAYFIPFQILCGVLYLAFFPLLCL